MSIRTIAIGVFLGNVATALLSLLVYSFMANSARQQATMDSVDAQYNALLESQKRERDAGNTN